MRRRSAGRSPALVGAIVLALIVVLTFLGFTKDIPFVNQPYEIRAAFSDGHGIRPNSPVRIAGVEVGRVTKVEGAGPRTRATMVTIAVNDKGRPIHKDATMRIRPRIFLEGNFFIEVQPGTPGTAELGEDDAIPVSQTSAATQLDQVLKVLRTDVRRDLRGIFAELFRTEAAGGARAFNRSLPDQAEAYRFSAIVADALQGRRAGDLARFLRNQGIVSEALDRDREALKTLLTDFNRTASALADNEADLRAAIDELPGTLEAALPAFASLNNAFPSVRRFAIEAQPGIRASISGSRAALPLVRQLRGLVSAGEARGLATDLNEAIEPAVALVQGGVSLNEQLRPIASCANEVLLPYGNTRVGDPNFPATGPVHQEFPKSLVGLAGESRSFDGNGQWFKVLGTGGAETVALGNGLFGSVASSLRGVNPPPVRQRPPLRPDVPCETQEAPNLDSRPAPPPPTVANRNQPAIDERLAKSRSVAIEVMNEQLRAEGDPRRVVDRDVTLEELQSLAKGLGLSGQLETFTKKALGG
jgi:phospholipid/cholesterol/gamma-HCH transport system substrate-binding protein